MLHRTKSLYTPRKTLSLRIYLPTSASGFRCLKKKGGGGGERQPLVFICLDVLFGNSMLTDTFDED